MAWKVFDSSGRLLTEQIATVAALDDISNVAETAIGNGEILVRSDTDWVNNTLAEAGIAPALATLDTTDVSSPPTAAELAAIYGDAATVGNRIVGVLNDGGAGTTYLILCDGTAFYHLTLTAAA